MNPIVEDCITMWMNVWKASLVTVTFGNPVMTMAMLESLMDDEEDDDEDDDGPWYTVTVWDWLH